jgi:hypothetical protein
LPRKSFDPEGLRRAGDALREDLLSSGYLRKQKQAALDHIDNLVKLNKNNWRWIVDGMNVILNGKSKNYRDRIGNLKKLLELLDDGTCLVVIREHVRIEPSDFKQFKNVEFVFLDSHMQDDKFLLYASMRSNLRQFTRFISNDYMCNNLPLNEHGYALRWWIMHQRVTFDKLKRKLYSQPNCFTRVQPIPGGGKDRKWLVPSIEPNSNTFLFSEYVQYHVLEEIKNN